MTTSKIPWFVRNLHIMRTPLFVITAGVALCLTVLNAVQIYAQQGDPQEAYFVFRTDPLPETFVIKITDPQRIQEARNILASGSRKLVTGTIIKQPVYYNSPWSFHLDPKSIGFADFAIELCDASIRYIENNRDTAYPDWCPWLSRLDREIPPPAKPGTENLKPTISMTFPWADGTYESLPPASLTLAANADDPDGTITKVEFHSGGLIGTATTYPYRVAWQNLAGGTYTVSTTVTDNNGEKTTSKGVTFVVKGGPPQLLADPVTSRGVALESTTFVKEPFPVVAEHSLGSQQQTRLVLIGLNFDVSSADVSAITAQAEDSQQKTYALPVEAVSRVPNFPWLTQLTVRLSDELQGVEEVWVSVSLRGVRTNKIPIKLK